ncbi:VapC ribonuclease [Metallosphaera sp. J1]|uniref:type II toxin-antitoxin system VapC family toxin n=1 Tax=Metallosphaera javensis (ex Hofmann et al. 2022) TaxID=99938 RepID=UPI001EDEF946|nr:PIN domain-containing protein [Metallosphaera javensis (ex Hofmann et al. 2022)]MCG3108980.1 VapC ribonuclease [Metallosphaera javensis (ex Hofmann et al. 2022)]
MILLDTSFLYSLYNRRDLNHARALQLLEEIQSLKYGQPVVCDYVIDEILTLVLSRHGKSYAGVVLNGIVKAVNQGLRLRFVDEDTFERGIQCFTRYHLSFTDCIQVAILLEEKDRYIASFDRGFDQVREIVRVQ